MASPGPQAAGKQNSDVDGAEGQHVSPSVAVARPARDCLLADVQRARLLAAAIATACARGGAYMTVQDVVERAGVSRRTFYQLFAGSEECLMAAVEHALECARECVREAYEEESPWRERIRVSLDALLTFFDQEPSMGRLLIVETLGAGAAVLALRATVLASLSDAVDLARLDGGLAVPSSLTAEGTVGGVLSVLHSRMLSGAQHSLSQLAPQLMAMIVLPYLGSQAARRELERSAPKRKPRPATDERDRALVTLPMRLTYRTTMVLRMIAARPGCSNREVGALAGISDQGQASKLLRRLQRLGLIVNANDQARTGAPNAWTLTPLGAQAHRAMSLER